MVSIPVVTIGAVDGAMLKAAAAANKPVHAAIDVQAASTPAVGRNIVGKIQGSDPEMVARGAKKGKPAQTIVFVGYDGEEVALFGGYDFLRRHHIVGSSISSTHFT